MNPYFFNTGLPPQSPLFYVVLPVIEIVVFNKSLVDIEHATLNITFLPTVEPLSTNFIDVYELKAGSMRSVALLAAPREKGSLENPIQIAVIYGHLVRSIFLPNMKIQVLGNLHKLLRFSESSHIDLKAVLNRYSDYLKPFTTPSALINLANNDPDAAIIKIRKLGEHISKSIASRYIPEYKDSWNFADVTKQLYDRQVIGAKAKGYIDHIRILGNQAAHPSITTPVQFDNEDAFQGCYALALFIKEIVT